LRAAPVTTPPDDRSPVATAYQWASRIMVVAMEMVLPMLAGHWLDTKLGTVVLFLLIGLGLGCTAAVVHLMQMTRSQKQSSKDR
jgi:F0F1-type ATP synthase assembly protein I